MIQMIALVLIYGVMMFIWTFVFLNRSHDKVNQSFLVFLSNILIWMVLNNLSEYGDGTTITIVTAPGCHFCTSAQETVRRLVTEGAAVRLNPREHDAFVWLPWRAAADRCFSPTNAEACLLLPRLAGVVP